MAEINRVSRFISAIRLLPVSLPVDGYDSQLLGDVAPLPHQRFLRFCVFECNRGIALLLPPKIWESNWRAGSRRQVLNSRLIPEFVCFLTNEFVRIEDSQTNTRKIQIIAWKICSFSYEIAPNLNLCVLFVESKILRVMVCYQKLPFRQQTQTIISQSTTILQLFNWFLIRRNDRRL